VPIEPGKFKAAIELANVCKLNLITDDTLIPPLLNDAARQADLTFDMFLKVDSGYHRCGVDPNSPEALEIPRQIATSTNLRFAGILTHAGHSYQYRELQERLAIARSERDLMTSLAEKLRGSGIEVPTVSVGSTPTVTVVDHLDGIDEARPGNYIFFDAFQATIGSCTFDDCALTVLAAVVHRDLKRSKVVIDAGAIALSKDRGAVEFEPNCGYGRVLDIEGNDLGLVVQAISQEHGTIAVSDSHQLERLKIGTRVRVLANHSCLTAPQHTYYHVLEQGEIVDRWKLYQGW
jgi:D-serine deaminase-like pyridoxal phosphate-dependent protein